MSERKVFSRRNFLKAGIITAAAGTLLSTSGDNPLLAEAVKLCTLLPGFEFFPTEKAKAIVVKVNAKNDGSMARGMVSHNLFILRDNIFVLPLRGFYRDMFFRDFRFASGYIDEPELDLNVLEQFERNQLEDGRIPTAISFVGHEAAFTYSSDDETTLLYAIHVSNVALTNLDFLTPGRIKALNKAWSFIENHVEDHKYISPSGARRGHVDAYRFVSNDVITQNQGLYAVALRSLIELNKLMKYKFDFKPGDKDLKTAIAEYQKPVNSNGYLPLSRNEKASAVGGIFPDYLMMTIFKEPLLTDTQVQNILEVSPGIEFNGYKEYPILTDLSGRSLNSLKFLNVCPEKTYQNNGIWPIWQQLLLSSAELHKVIDNHYRAGELARLIDMRYPEWYQYRTDGSLYLANQGYLWNVDIIKQFEEIDRFLLTKG
jgi:hypothetical protein